MIKKSRYIFLFAFLVFLTNTQAQDVRKTFNRAFHYLTFDNQAAAETFSEVLRMDSTHAEAHYFRGIANYKLEKYYSALTDFTNAIHYDENLQLVHIYKGFIYRKLNENDSAIASFNRYIVENPQDTSAYNFVLRGRMKSSIGDYEGATDDFQTAINLKPIEESYYYYKFIAHFDRTDYQKALEQIDKCIEINPNFYGYYYYRGNTYYALEDFDLAVDEYSKALEIDIDNADIYYQRGLAEQAREKYKAAILDFDTAIAYNSLDGTYFFQRGHAKLAIGDKLGACDDWYVAGSLGYYEDFQKIKEVCE